MNTIPTPSLRLPADHTVLRVKPSLSNTLIVLVELTDNRVTPWATYRVHPDGACYHGHYFYRDEKGAAVEDYLDR